jgi:hypothetical protein
MQFFLLYVRVQAKRANDRTPISIRNPLSSLLESQLGADKDDGILSNTIVKGMASSFLSSSSTVLEYDLRQAQNMQGGLIFNMLFMWFLHFKMEQVQPLLVQTITGFMNMIYSPLFQVYVLGRNLQRPFVTQQNTGTDTSTVDDQGANEQQKTGTLEDEKELHLNPKSDAVNVEDDDDDEDDEEEDEETDQQEDDATEPKRDESKEIDESDDDGTASDDDDDD